MPQTSTVYRQENRKLFAFLDTMQSMPSPRNGRGTSRFRGYPAWRGPAPQSGARGVGALEAYRGEDDLAAPGVHFEVFDGAKGVGHALGRAGRTGTRSGTR